MNSKLFIWLGLSTVLVLTVVVIRWQRHKQLDLSLTEFIALLGSVLAMVSSFELFYKILVVNAWQDCLEEEDTVTLIFGGVALLWVAGNEVGRQFVPEQPRRIYLPKTIISSASCSDQF